MKSEERIVTFLFVNETEQNALSLLVPQTRSFGEASEPLCGLEPEAPQARPAGRALTAP